MREIISSLDLGSDSIKLIVGEMFNKKLNVLACSEVKSKGIKKGLVVNPELALESLKEVFKMSEDIIGIKLSNVLVCIPAFFAEFDICEGYTTITRESKIIDSEDLVRAMQASVYNRISSNKELVSIMPVEYILNENESVKDPIGKSASRLTVKSVISTIPKKNVYGIISLLDSIGVNVSDISFNALADYNEFSNELMNEKDCAVINIGDEKTEVSIINRGVLIATEVLEIGGKNIDKDIMYMYNVSRKTANFLKYHFAYATSKNASSSEFEYVEDKDGINVKVNQYEISEVIYSRLKEILDLSKKQINILTKKKISYIIVTGGTIELNDANIVVEEVLGHNAITGSVNELGVRNNKYSSALGFIKYYYRKLNFRKKLATTLTEEESKEIFILKKRNTSNNTILGKIFSYFFDN